MSGAEIPLAMTAVSAGASLFGTASSAGAQGRQKQATLMAAQEQAAAHEFEGRQLDLQGKRIRSAGAVDEAARRIDLESSLQTIEALRAGRGLDPDSPTGRAITAGATERGEKNILTSKTNYALQAANSELQGELSRRKARFTLMAGEAGAAAIDDQIDATWASGIGKVAGIGMSALKMPAVR
jgi:hypothetical protein